MGLGLGLDVCEDGEEEAGLEGEGAVVHWVHYGKCWWDGTSTYG